MDLYGPALATASSVQWSVPQAARAVGVAVVSAIGFYLLGQVPLAGPAFPASALATVLSLVAVSTFLDVPREEGDRSLSVRPSFVGEIATLVYFGAWAMVVAAVAGSAARLLANPPRDRRVRVALVDLVSSAAAAQAAGASYGVVLSLGSLAAWPWLALPLATAAFAYCVIGGSIEDLAAPRLLGFAATYRWPAESLRGLPTHVVGAGVAAGVIELVRHQAWLMLPVAAVPLYFIWRGYVAHVDRDHEDRRRLDAIASVEHGVCLVDRTGRIVAWNDALEALLDCPASRANGRWLNVAVPALGSTPLPRAVQDALASHAVRTVPQVPLRLHGRAKVLTATIVPDARGATVVWAEAGERTGLEQGQRRVDDWFDVVSLGVADGLWLLEETTGSVRVSARWRDLVGVGPGDGPITLDQWLACVHEDDRGAFKNALNALATGGTASLEHEQRVRRDDGSWRRVLVRAAAAADADGRVVRVGGSVEDVTDTSAVPLSSETGDPRDPLTGLLTRAAFLDRVEQRLSAGRTSAGARFAVIHLDLDRFKVVNDSLGHVVGDQLLVDVARRIQAALRPGDAIARLSGDEFAVMLNSINDEMQANVVGFRLQEALKAPFSVGGRDVVTSASIGIAMSRPDYATAEDLMRDSDTAMHHAKSHGKARHELFDVDMHVRAKDRLGLESDLRDAVNCSGFEVHYQPIVSLSTRRCIGFESLVRWNRHGKAVSPADFIPMAEELGIIEPLGTWVMQQACRKFVDWKARYPNAGLDFITVNVSARQLVQQGFIYLVEQTIEQNHMRPSDLRLEITETALMDAPQFAAEVLAELREHGVRIYLDDFGTGYSSLSHLHKLPVDALKIDRSFVRGLLTPERPAIVESILALARTLNTSVVAEGIEDERQALELERLGCRHAQGYYFSKPIPADHVEELLASNRTLGAMRVPTHSVVTSLKREIA